MAEHIQDNQSYLEQLVNTIFIKRSISCTTKLNYNPKNPNFKVLELIKQKIVLSSQEKK